MNKKLQETLIKKINESVKRTLIDNLVLDQLDPKYFDKDGLLNLDKINMFPPELINLIAEDLLENGTIGDYDIFDDDMNVEIQIEKNNVNDDSTIITKSLYVYRTYLQMNISFDYDTDAYQGARATYYMPAEPNEASCEVTKADVNNITINDMVDITNPEIIKKFEEWVMSDDCLITYYFEKRIEERILDEMD